MSSIDYMECSIGSMLCRTAAKFAMCDAIQIKQTNAAPGMCLMCGKKPRQLVGCYCGKLKKETCDSCRSWLYPEIYNRCVKCNIVVCRYEVCYGNGNFVNKRFQHLCLKCKRIDFIEKFDIENKKLNLAAVIKKYDLIECKK